MQTQLAAHAIGNSQMPDGNNSDSSGENSVPP